MLATSDLRSLLERAWRTSQAANPVAKLRDTLRSGEDVVRDRLAGGTILSVQANNRRTEFAPYGLGNYTDTEFAEGLRELIDQFGGAQKYLKACARHAANPFESEDITIFDGALVDPAVTVDDPRWDDLCDEFSVNKATVVGVVVSDPAIFLWLMYSLFPVTEVRSDYRDIRMKRGMAWV